MQTKDAYNDWAKTYDSVTNPTRDLEAKAIRTVLKKVIVDKILELGCGTGKNTEWLAQKSKQLTAVDYSVEMQKIAREKITNTNVLFEQADITLPWNFEKANLITCSLVLEHIENITFVFEQASKYLATNGLFYICELHPFKQLLGSRAKFEKEGTLQHLEYFIHHLSDFFDAAVKNNFVCEQMREWFDEDDKSQMPRLVSFLFRRK